jgi:hypothetical protein
MAEYLIAKGRIGCVPGVDFGAHGEGYIRFCFARSREELSGALVAMAALFQSDISSHGRRTDHDDHEGSKSTMKPV